MLVDMLCCVGLCSLPKLAKIYSQKMNVDIIVIGIQMKMCEALGGRIRGHK